MSDEQRRVISVLRALLISNAKKGSISLKELEREYYLLEGKTTIPTFEYKNACDFLRCSGEFMINIENGVVVVREKPRLESLHIKKLVTEQKSSPKSSTFVSPRKNINRVFSPVHAGKPSVVFTFDQLTSNINSLKTSSLNTLNEPKLKPLSNGVENSNQSPNFVQNKKPYHDGKPTIAFSFDTLKEQALLIQPLEKVNIGKLSVDADTDTSVTSANSSLSNCRSVRDASTETNIYENSPVDARLQLLEAILSFRVVKTGDQHYGATVCVNNVDYYDYGSNADEAKNNVAAKALKYMKEEDQRKKFEVNSSSTTDKSFLSSENKNFNSMSDYNSFAILKELKGGLQYHCNKLDNYYAASVKVDGVEFLALGATASLANNNVASKVLKTMLEESSKEQRAMLLQKMNKTKVDKHDNYGKGNDLSNIVSNTTNDSKVDYNASSKSFDQLKNMYFGLYYQSLGRDSNNNFRVAVEVESIRYYGVGKTAKQANYNAADNCLQSIRSGTHRIEAGSRGKDFAPKSAFNILKDMYFGLEIKSLGCDGYNNYQALMEVDFISYYGNGKSPHEANNNAAENCLRSIQNGCHDAAKRIGKWQYNNVSRY